MNHGLEKSAAWSSDRLLSSSNDEAQGSNEGEEEDLWWKSLKTLTCRVSHFRGRGITKCFGENIKILNCYRGTKATREVSWRVIDFGIGGISSGISFPQILSDREKSRVLPFSWKISRLICSYLLVRCQKWRQTNIYFRRVIRIEKKNDRVILFPKKEKGTQI